MKTVLKDLSLRGASFARRCIGSPQSKLPPAVYTLGKGLVITALLILGVACASPLGNVTPTGDRSAQIVRDYRTWTAMFQTVQTISMQLMLLCRLMTAEEQAYLESEHGRHFVQVYANPLAEATLRQESQRTFPQGSVIVKEKLDQDPRLADPVVNVKPTGLGIMIKREPAYDAAGGNWEYLYVDDTGIITRDQKQLEHCRACHMGNAAQDAIFYPRLFQQ